MRMNYFEQEKTFRRFFMVCYIHQRRLFEQTRLFEHAREIYTLNPVKSPPPQVFFTTNFPAYLHVGTIHPGSVATSQDRGDGNSRAELLREASTSS